MAATIGAHTAGLMKNKTLAAWLAFVGGPLGLYRFYLYGPRDWLGYAHWPITAVGLYGFWRVQQFGLDDQASWILLPCWGFLFATTALTAIVYGLMSPSQWNARFNPDLPPESVPGQTNWFTIGAVALSLMVGTTVLMSSIVYSFQRYFEYQIDEARKISQ